MWVQSWSLKLSITVFFSVLVKFIFSFPKRKRLVPQKTGILWTFFIQAVNIILLNFKMAGFVPTLPLFFMYSVSAVNTTTTKSKESRSSSLAVKSGPTSKTTNTAYKPPHLRRKEAFRNNNSSDSESSSRYDFSSSDSDHSDTDGYSKGSDRYRSSKTRLNAIYCIQVCARVKNL